jgi:hypothetical protein
MKLKLININFINYNFLYFKLRSLLILTIEDNNIFYYYFQMQIKTNINEKNWDKIKN